MHQAEHAVFDGEQVEVEVSVCEIESTIFTQIIGSDKDAVSTYYNLHGRG